MSIPVDVADLAEALEDYGYAYLLTVRDDQRPHVVAVTPSWDRQELAMPVGRGTAKNAAARASVTLCYPPAEPGGYSLIVDGTAEVENDVVRIRPTTAVRHRPAPEGFAGSPTGCGQDCVPVTTPDA